jgi:hypothetical protein
MATQVKRVRKPITAKAKAAAARATAPTSKATAKTATPTKRVSTRTATTTKSARPPAKKGGRPAKTTGPVRGRKAAPVKRGRKPAATNNRTNRTAGYDEHGFVNGTDSSILVEELIAGGVDRGEIAARALERMEPTTRSGQPKNLSSLTTNLLAKLSEKGYTVESSWRLVPPA